MRRARASRTAQFVALNRALGNLSPEVPGFSDPVAEHLLSPRWRDQVQRAAARRSGSPYPFWVRRGMAVFNQFRTVMLDRAIAESQPVEQLVILGAGLDGRAYRLDCLSNATVFEVDQPNTQTIKRQRARDLTPRAREIRYVEMDLERDDLVERLSAAGHDRARPTFWLWEGVTMYLAPSEVMLTLTRLASISTANSRLALTYLAKIEPTPVQRISTALFGILIGEPLRSTFGVSELDERASSTGWRTLSDSGIEDWKRELAASVALSQKQVGIQWNERIWTGQRSS